MFGALLLAACSTGSPAATTVATSMQPTTSSPAATTDETTTTTTQVAIDPVALLDTALATYADGYRFSSVAIVDGSAAGSTEGLVIGDESEVVIRSGDAAVSYLITPEGRWVRTDTGPWELLTEEVPATDPLADFADPANLRVIRADGDVVVVVGSYPAARFGGTGDSVDLTMTFRNGLLVEASYERTGEVTAQVTTTFAPLEPTDVISDPTG